jgi:dTDP-4-amino-4,6-dideoxygalactose transaminase
MIPRFSPNYRWSDVLRCFSKASTDDVKRLEKCFVKKSCHEEAIFFRYGRSGLFFLLKALKAKNKKVILPSYTCVVVAHAIMQSGNIPVFLDNKPGGFQPSPEDYFEKIDQDTIMVMPTNLFGIGENFEETYHKIKKQYPHVFILQDCAHSFFCEDTQGNVVTRWGDGALFGMNISKLVNSVKGGMLTVKDSTLAERIRKEWEQFTADQQPPSSFLSRLYVLAASLAFTRIGYALVQFISKKTSFLKSQTNYFQPDVIDLPKDFSEKPPAFNALVGFCSLQRYEERIKNRKLIAKLYCDRLVFLKDTGFIDYPEYQDHYTWSHFPVLLQDEETRDFVRDYLEKATKCEIGIIVDYSVSDLPAYQSRGFSSSPIAYSHSKRIINLPLTFGEGLDPCENWKELAENVVQKFELCYKLLQYQE